MVWATLLRLLHCTLRMVMTSFWYFTKMDVVYFECKNRQQQILSRKKRETKYLKKVASCHPATATTNIAVEVCV